MNKNEQVQTSKYVLEFHVWNIFCNSSTSLLKLAIFTLNFDVCFAITFYGFIFRIQILMSLDEIQRIQISVFLIEHYIDILKHIITDKLIFKTIYLILKTKWNIFSNNVVLCPFIFATSMLNV